MLITRDDIQRIGDEETLLHFLQEKLNLPIPEGATLAQIALPLPLPFLGLDDSISEHIIDCQDFSGFSQDTLGDRRPFLIRFRREQNYPEILRRIAEGLSQKNINPSEIFVICTDENFQPFALAHFNDSDTKDWNSEVLNIFIWTQGNTRLNTGAEHELSTIFFSQTPSSESDNTSKTQGESSYYRGDPNRSEDLLTKILNIGTPLGQYGDIHSGINLCYRNAFVIDDGTCKRLSNEDPNSADLLIEQFPDEPEKWRWELRNIIYMPNHKNKPQPWSGIRNESEAEQILKETYPAISKHMDNYKDRLKKSANAVPFYWEFPPRNILQKLGRPKIFYRTTSTSMQAAYDESYRFLTSATHFIPTEDLSLLAILNSKLFNWYAQGKWKSPKPNIKALSFSKQNMKKAPIAPRTETQEVELSDLVRQILKDFHRPEVPDIEKIEKKIDALVYDLYELTATDEVHTLIWATISQS